MNKQLTVWKLIAESLKQKTPVMLLYVLESSGSSPGRQGFFMAVNAQGEMQGSIGGGIMEHKFVEMAKERLKLTTPEQTSGEIKKQIHDKSAAKNQSGMICSGEQTIFLYPISTRDENQIQKIIATLEQNKNATLKLSPGGIKFSKSVIKQDFRFQMISPVGWSYEERLGYKNRLSIIGGGHCALAVSNLMSQMDFYVSVYDDRKDLKTMIENHAAHEKHFIDDYSELKNLIAGGTNHYVVIMTFGYRTDDIALRALLGKDFKYIGLLGSKSKVKEMFDSYRKEGIEQKLLQRIRTPVGIPIKSQTPEEIAVSIAAEIIQVKNSDL